MNCIRTCVYVWVLASVGAALANLADMAKSCDECSNRTFRDVDQVACDEVLICSQCKGESKCQEVAKISQQCKGCSTIRHVGNDHHHTSVFCHNCNQLVPVTYTAYTNTGNLIAGLAQNCDGCRRYRTRTSLGNHKMCDISATCDQCHEDFESRLVYGYRYQCIDPTCKRIETFDNDDFDHEKSVCPSCRGK